MTDPWGLPLADIEAAILAALAPLKDSLGVATLAGYEGELSTAEELRAALPRFPGLLVLYAGSRVVPDDGGGGAVEMLSFVVLVADRSLRSRAEAKKGGGRAVGCYALLDGVRRALWGRIVISGLGPAELTRQEVVFQDGAVAVFSAAYDITQRLRPH